MSFPRHTKIYQSDEPEGGRTNGSTSLGDHRSDESSAGYSFVGCSPAEPASASPTATSLSQHPAAVSCSAAKRNLSPFLLSHLRGPLHFGRFCISLSISSSRAAGVWESRRDFQGLWERWETCFWFSSAPIRVGTSARMTELLELFRRRRPVSAQANLITASTYFYFGPAPTTPHSGLRSSRRRS